MLRKMVLCGFLSLPKASTHFYFLPLSISFSIIFPPLGACNCPSQEYSAERGIPSVPLPRGKGGGLTRWIQKVRHFRKIANLKVIDDSSTSTSLIFPRPLSCEGEGELALLLFFNCVHSIFLSSRLPTFC
ncbi:hypothetical protein K438DRAFT_515632 [Mycena galopus ATCC 62051]|nr:hypothetical protein K438DRAFT_515632 [Mycena galopus ATCC 62051]